MTQFLNFHTHNFPSTPQEKSIYNLLIQDFRRFGEVENNWLSAGIHPWYAHPEDWQSQLTAVAQVAGHKNVLAIGECGLDRGILLPLETQLKIFAAQVKLAEQLQKPVIIHCVRAFNELLQWKKQVKPSVPLIVHGFNNKPEIMQQLLAHGFYFSLGVALLNPESNALKVLKTIPLTRLFLENDDRNTPIEKIYEAAAVQLEIPISALKNQIWTNFATVFNQ
ncbi:TatD family deoxyribonuclease [Runella sp. CRIBMP]|uniref:TatD family hydrolase n=1 Tax=Runella sp. CRIBMP TaxID=2683261 RepID=UPI0014133DC9|nr:TatD family hydrolase [Runella sp. CRIBMP]NBB18263.1 TatD family deoxyribonuclease [Runella sp. CRIBMP]